MKYLLALLFCFTLAAQQTVNNFTVKTNLIVGSINVGTSITPPSYDNASSWYKISTWGDSLTAGAGTTGTQYPYPAVLQTISGFTVLNGGVGGETSTQIKARMIAATNQYRNSTIIWAGRNNYSSLSTVTADIAQMVSTLASVGNTNYLVMGVINGLGEGSGTSGYNQIIALNNALSATYGSKYVPIREFLVASYNPSLPQDVIDHAADIPPNSLRSDFIHLNNSGYGYVANYISTNKFDVLRSGLATFPSQKVIASEFAAPPYIGSTTPGNATFDTVYNNNSISTNLYVINGSGAQKAITLSGDGIDFQLAASGLIFIPDNSYNIGRAGAYRPANVIAGTGLYAPSAYSTSSYTTNLYINNGSGTQKRIVLSGDGSDFQSENSGFIFIPDNSSSIGRFGAYRPSYVHAGTAVYSPSIYGTSVYATNVFVNNGLGSQKTFTVTGDGSDFQFGAGFYFIPGSTHNIGRSDGGGTPNNVYVNNQVQAPIHVVGAVGTTGPTITTGANAPTASQPNGSLYMRTGGTGPNLYVRENGAWVAK